MGDAISGQKLLKKKRCKHSIKIVQNMCSTNELTPSPKGQIILKCLFGVFNFFQKRNENTSHTSKNEFICLFFGRIHSLTIGF